MDQQTPQASAPAPAPQTSAPAPASKKSNAWKWILGGCLFVVIISLIAMVALGWWGARKVKNEIKKYEPNLEEIKNNMEKMSKEGEGWQKKSEEFRNTLPNPEDFQNEVQKVR